jgi:hypothetical protein
MKYMNKQTLLIHYTFNCKTHEMNKCEKSRPIPQNIRVERGREEGEV